MSKYHRNILYKTNQLEQQNCYIAIEHAPKMSFFLLLTLKAGSVTFREKKNTLLHNIQITYCGYGYERDDRVPGQTNKLQEYIVQFTNLLILTFLLQFQFLFQIFQRILSVSVTKTKKIS